MRIVRTCVVGVLTVGLVVTASACERGDEAAPPTTATTVTSTAATAPPPTTTSTPEPTITATSAAPTTAPAPTVATTDPAITSTVAPTTTITTTPTTITGTTTMPRLVDVKVYLVRDDQLVIAHRDVAGPAVLRAALVELLAGPTTAETTGGLRSEVPMGTALLGVNLVDGLATVDLSADVERDGDTASLTARIGQIVFTATQFPNVDEVLFRLDGEPIGAFGGEGIALDRPVSRDGIDRALTGGVLFDTPARGATVRSPFTVTGEADVFEAQFAIEVWSNGVLVGGVAPVSAGAWGEWAGFEATITIDAATGPIDVVARDEGGCGTDPGCPPVVDTVLPLVLVR